MKKPNNIEQEAAVVFDAIFASYTPVKMALIPAKIFTTISLLQLALRHQAISPNLNQLGRKLTQDYIDALVTATNKPELKGFIEKGFDPAHDTYDLNGYQISAQPKINLVTLLQQAADQISHPTLRGILYSFINLSRKHEPVNIEIDLATLLHTDSPADLDSNK